MAKVNKLKNQARHEEQRENWSRAIELYTQALDASRKESQGFADLSLYNRIGDIYLRIGQKNTAVRYYEQAIELYAEQDLHTSAIALCNKVLRILPDRSTVFLQLGRLNLATNLVAEGRAHYHRYAKAMRKRGSEGAALDGLEELISATGDGVTLTVWAGWLAESSDEEAALSRIEALREALERHGIDPDEVAAQVRAGAVVGFERTGGAARDLDPLAGAFLTAGGDEAPTGEATPESDLGAVPTGTPEEEFGARAPAASTAGGDDGWSGDGDAAEGTAADAGRQPGSIPWEQEVEEIIAEFDPGLDEPWEGAMPEGADLELGVEAHAPSAPDPEADEASAHAAARDGGDARATGAPDREETERDWDDEAADVDSPRAGYGLETDEAGSAASAPHDRAADAESGEAFAEPEGHPSERPSVGEEPERGEIEATAPEASEGAAAEGMEARSMEGEAPEPSWMADDDLEAIVRAATEPDRSSGFEAEPPVVEDDVPEPEAMEPSERDAEPAGILAEARTAAGREPADVEPLEVESATVQPERFDEPLEAGPQSPDEDRRDEAIVPERDEADGATDEDAWADEARRALERQAAGAPEADAAVRPEDDGDRSEADELAGAARATPEPEPAAEEAPEPEPVAEEAPEPEPVAEEAPEPEPVGAGNGRYRTLGRPEAHDEDEELAPLAEPRLTVEEDPEDAFRDWVQSASMGILRRALAELESRKEHERALAVIKRLTELEEPAVDFKIRRVEYLESLGRVAEARDACVALGASLEAAGRAAEAHDVFLRAERLAPDDEGVRDALERLRESGADSEPDAVPTTGPKRPYMPDHVNGGSERAPAIDRPIPTLAIPVEDHGPAPRPYSGVAGGSEAGADFEQLLSEFRAELHEKPARSDSSSRTELGARLKEMGRLDDAIRELQGAVREPNAPPLAFELLGEAFLEKGQPRIAVRFLEKALGSLSQGDRDILGVLYQLGVAYEALSDDSKALICYERIFSVDIDYRDIQDRILSVSA